MIIIYSHDRACQLDLLLKSIKNKMPEQNVTVLFSFSTPEYQSGYERIKLLHDITLVQKTTDTFHTLLKNAVQKTEDEHVILLCDDDVFIKSVNLPEIDCNSIGLNLRYSPKLKNSYHTGLMCKLPLFTEYGVNLKWDWNAYPGEDRWGYPYQAGGMAYSRDFLEYILSTIKPSNPNEFETQMMNNKFAYNRMNILCNKTSSVVNLSINRVQTTVAYNRGGRDVNYSPEELNKEFLNGKHICFDQFDEFDTDCEFIETEIKLKEIE